MLSNSNGCLFVSGLPNKIAAIKELPKELPLHRVCKLYVARYRNGSARADQRWCSAAVRGYRKQQTVNVILHRPNTLQDFVIV
jgi:hypothetical protein